MTIPRIPRARPEITARSREHASHDELASSLSQFQRASGCGRPPLDDYPFGPVAVVSALKHESLCAYRKRTRPSSAASQRTDHQPDCITQPLGARSGTGILRSLVPVLRCERWEPSWEPFAVDFYGRLWTPADRIPLWSGRHGPPRTPMDGVRPSTDQKVGDSSSSGRATKAVAVYRFPSPGRGSAIERDSPGATRLQPDAAIPNRTRVRR